MRKSNEELWEATTIERLARWDRWETYQRQGLKAFADAIRADEAEHAKDEQRQACVKAYVDARRDGGGDMECQVAILNAGKAPVIKPGMLVKVRGLQNALAWEWQHDTDHDSTLYVPLTRAEIDKYREKAPEEVV